MTAAWLVRHSGPAEAQGEDGFAHAEDRADDAELLFEGDLAGALAAARALPADQRARLTIETEEHGYSPELFDRMTADELVLDDHDLRDAIGIVRFEKAALERWRGDRRLMPPGSIISERVETITAILRNRKTVDDVEDHGDTWLIRITAADADAG